MSAAPASARRLVILSGSPKPTGSTSAVLGARLAELMAPKGWESVTFRSAAVLASPERWAEFAAAYGAATSSCCRSRSTWTACRPRSCECWRS